MANRNTFPTGPRNGSLGIRQDLPDTTQSEHRAADKVQAHAASARHEPMGNLRCSALRDVVAGFGPENVGLIFPMIASHLKTG